MDVERTILRIDFPLLEALTPAIGKLAPQILLENFHFHIVQRLLQPDGGAAHQLPVPEFHRGDGAEHLCLDVGGSLL